jgi:hypothetical protein
MDYFEIGFIVFWGVVMLGSVFPDLTAHRPHEPNPPRSEPNPPRRKS